MVRNQEVRFTHAEIAKISLPAEGRDTYPDPETPGLELRVSATGVKSFSVVKKQKNGRVVRVTLGKFPTWSVEAARREARRLAGEIAAGVDIASRQQADRAMLTLGELFDICERDRTRKRSALNTRQTFERWVGRIPTETSTKKHGRPRVKPAGSEDWSARRIDAVNQRDVAQLLERIKSQGLGTTANRVQEILRAMYSHAKARKLYEGTNPAEGLQPAPETARTRFLRSDELPRFLDALKQIEQPWRDYFTLLLTVGYRRTAVASMRWADIDLSAGVWHVPTAVSKNGEATVLPLVGEAAMILKRRAKDAESEFVFPGGSPAGHLSQPKKQWAALLELAQLDDLHLHDLRRTLGSWLAMSGHSLPEIGRVLGHKDQKSTQVYARLQMQTVSAASSKAQAAMLRPAKVVPIKRRRA